MVFLLEAFDALIFLGTFDELFHASGGSPGFDPGRFGSFDIPVACGGLSFCFGERIELVHHRSISIQYSTDRALRLLPANELLTEFEVLLAFDDACIGLTGG